MKAFLRDVMAVLEAAWSLMKTSNIYAGAIPDAECIEYRTVDEWRRRAR
jgi:hypothetical protein